MLKEYYYYINDNIFMIILIMMYATCHDRSVSAILNKRNTQNHMIKKPPY